MDFSEKLYILRKNSGLTQELLAEQLEVSRQSISKWEAGQVMPEPDKIVALADLFGVTTDYLLKPSESENTSIPMPQKQSPIPTGRRAAKRRIFLICAAVFLLAFTLYLLLEQLSWEFELLWNISHGINLPLMIGSAAASLSIFLCLRKKD